MSHRRPLTRAATTVGAFLLGGSLLWACGPYISDWLLGDDENVLTAPTARFQSEVERLAPARVPARLTQQTGQAAESDPFERTAVADRADLAAALEAAKVPAGRREAIHASYRQIRETFRFHAATTSPSWTGPGVEIPENSPLNRLRYPEGLPGEFLDYSRGAAAYHRTQLAEARRQWEALLARPAGERRFRSTWAAFMLGKTALRAKDFAGAVRWFERTREIAGEKDMRDSLGLAAESLGWQARAELERGRLAPAIALYAEQTRAGDTDAIDSLRRTIARALDAGPEALAEVARDDRARPFVTALVLSRSEGFYLERENPEQAAEAESRKWLEAVEKAGVTSAEEADRLAWFAYRAADFEAAERWLKRAGDAPMAKWIRAKLLLRAGRLEEAEDLLAEVSRELPGIDMDTAEAFYLQFEAGSPLATPLQALGEAGAVALSRQEYVSALDRLLRSGYWRDAAYVAERVLTPEELKAYVDRQWPADLAAKHNSQDWSQDYAGLVLRLEAATAYELRYLLGRRLARLGRHAEARDYLPAEARPDLDTLANGLRQGKDRGRPASERASSLFEAACASRWKGLELLGTEVDPDWFEQRGMFDLGLALDDRLEREEGNRLAPSSDEVERARQHAAQPARRFHYRYTAADLGWQAAALLPDGSPEKARILASSGSWIKDRDPEAADRFYKELVRCCRSTDLGREAARRNWFPEVQGCGPEQGAEE